MKLLLDMNLPPRWAVALSGRGFIARHWFATDDPGACDEAIMESARKSGEVVITLDLDFTRILALTRAAGPSVVLIRAWDVLSEETLQQVASGLEQASAGLEAGALVVIEPGRRRVRSLPIRSDQ